MSRSLSQQLLDWYDAHARKLPWRALPGQSVDPYRVWLSEIMLQQTTVATVGTYFLAFTREWPTVRDLAAADLDDVLRAWAGLGYYARARNLHACAKKVVDDYGGVFPDTEAELIKLPGIGAYTAGAIAAIAFDRRAAAVDGNVERVISRLAAITEPLPGSKPAIKKTVEELLPDACCGDFAQAMMDLGATICTPKSPKCLICPWQKHCKSQQQGIAETLPVKAPKKQRPVRKARIFWVERDDGAVLMRRRPEKGLLGGMLEFPSNGWDTNQRDTNSAPFEADWQATGLTAEHTFTHFHLVLSIIKTTSTFNALPDNDSDWKWVEQGALPHEALPTAMKKVAVAVLGPDSMKKRQP